VPDSGLPRPPEAGRSLVRPYAVTGGRTKPRYQLEMALLVERVGSALTPEVRGGSQSSGWREDGKL
jgi:hypothetical protein